jgi:hypothetical protein
MRAHMDATIEPARRIIARLLEADAQFFREQHYLHPLLAGLQINDHCIKDA